MPSPFFRNSRIKIEQARRHIAEVIRMLDEHAESLIITHEIPAWLDLSQYAGKTVISLGTVTVRGIPDIVPATIGDAIHNLRSALDIMAADMARINNESADKVSFPFGEDLSKFNKALKDRKFLRCGEVAVETVKRCAPYQEGNALLYAIHQLDIADKHDMLLPIANSIGMPIIDTWTAKIVSDPTRPSAITYIWAATNPLRGNDVVSSLGQMVELITEVVDRFETALSDAAESGVR